MLIDVVHEPRRHRYRLIGTDVVQASGDDRTAGFFGDVDFLSEAKPTSETRGRDIGSGVDKARYTYPIDDDRARRAGRLEHPGSNPSLSAILLGADAPHATRCTKCDSGTG
jgi:hypothetical protein